MQCMKFQDHINISQPKNFTKTSSILKKPQNFSKTPKPRFQNMKMHESERFEAYQVSERGLGRENKKLSRERSSEMKNRIAQNLYIEVQ